MTMDKAGKEGDKDSTTLGTEDLSQPSTLDKLTSEIEEGKQFTGKEVLDILSADGRKQKGRAEKAETNLNSLTQKHDALTTQFNTMSSQLDDLVKAADEAEVAKVGDDPVAIGSLRARQANAREALRLQKLEASYTSREAKATEKEAEADRKLTSINIKLAAMVAGVDEAELADHVPDGDPKRLEKTAKLLKQGGSSGDKSLPAALRRSPASPISAGGGGIDGLSPDEKITRGLAQKKK